METQLKRKRKQKRITTINNHVIYTIISTEDDTKPPRILAGFTTKKQAEKSLNAMFLVTGVNDNLKIVKITPENADYPAVIFTSKSATKHITFRDYAHEVVKIYNKKAIDD